jgi:hypothetical protein
MLGKLATAVWAIWNGAWWLFDWVLRFDSVIKFVPENQWAADMIEEVIKHPPPLELMGFAVFGLFWLFYWWMSRGRELTQPVEIQGAGMNDQTFVSAGVAIRAVMDARPNSIETTAINLRDKAAIGAIRSWGRRASSDLIQTKVPTLEEIPAATWQYAEIDLSSIEGPLPTNKMQFLRQISQESRPLYEAVRFNKSEIDAFCLREKSR